MCNKFCLLSSPPSPILITYCYCSQVSVPHSCLPALFCETFCLNRTISIAVLETTHWRLWFIHGFTTDDKPVSSLGPLCTNSSRRLSVVLQVFQSAMIDWQHAQSCASLDQETSVSVKVIIAKTVSCQENGILRPVSDHPALIFLLTLFYNVRWASERIA